MAQPTSPFSPPSGNIMWLTLSTPNSSGIIRGQLLGLGADQSLLCSLPDPLDLSQIEIGMGCQGHTLLEGETYQFQATIREILFSPPRILLNRPYTISRRPPRIYPRIPVTLSGSIRPMGGDQQILAVLPAIISNLCLTGCQLKVEEHAWPPLASFQVIVTCRLPEGTHTSKFRGTIEWIEPHEGLLMGIHFQFASPTDVSCQDLTRWFQSQQAKLINTVV